MKKTVIYTTLLIGLATLWSCKKEYSIENEKGQTPDFSAVINGVQWVAADSMQGASIAQGQITITGTSADSQQLAITLGDTVLGAYTLNKYSGSIAVFARLDSAGLFPFTTNQGVDSSQSGGTVTITSIDPVNKTISGVFAFRAYRQTDDALKVFASGVFYNIPYTGSGQASVNNDTLVAAIDGSNWVGQHISVSVLGGQLAISGTGPAGSEEVSLILPSTVTPGTYDLSNNILAGYQGVYEPVPGEALSAVSGSLTVIENNYTSSRITGSFQFVATDATGGAGNYTISNGYFSVFYGP